MTAMGGTRQLAAADALPAGLPDGLIARVRGAAATQLARRLGPARLFSPSEDDRALVWAVISERLAEAHREHVLAGNTPLDQQEQQRVARAVFDALLGLGPLERHLAGEDVEELLVNGHQRAFVVRAGGSKDQVETGFVSEAELRAFAARTVAVAGRRLDEANPKADARLPDGSRLHVICPPLAPFTCLTIRRHRLLAHTLQDLLALGTLTSEVAGLLGAAVRAGLNLLISGGTGNAWANPPPAETPRRLVLGGGFVVDGGRDRRMTERARVLGFGSLRGYLQARCDTGHSIPRIAAELGVGDWRVQTALARSRVRLAPRPQRLAQQRRRYTEERIAARVAGLGFTNVGAYLTDRVVDRGWLLAEVAAELAAHRLTVRRLLDRHGIRRVRRTRAERAAAEAGLRVQVVGWRARRAGRLAELGFADLAGYLRARHVEQGWSVKRMRAELGVGRRWLVGELARLGLRP
jgi:Type II/IV secretion system protein